MSKDKKKFLKNISILLWLAMIFPSNGTYTMDSFHNSKTVEMEVFDKKTDGLTRNKITEDDGAKALLSDQINPLLKEELHEDQQLNNEANMANDGPRRSLSSNPTKKLNNELFTELFELAEDQQVNISNEDEGQSFLLDQTKKLNKEELTEVQQINNQIPNGNPIRPLLSDQINPNEDQTRPYKVLLMKFAALLLYDVLRYGVFGQLPTERDKSIYFLSRFTFVFYQFVFPLLDQFAERDKVICLLSLFNFFSYEFLIPFLYS